MFRYSQHDSTIDQSLFFIQEMMYDWWGNQCQTTACDVPDGSLHYSDMSFEALQITDHFMVCSAGCPANKKENIKTPHYWAFLGESLVTSNAFPRHYINHLGDNDRAARVLFVQHPREEGEWSQWLIESPNLGNVSHKQGGIAETVKNVTAN